VKDAKTDINKISTDAYFTGVLMRCKIHVDHKRRQSVTDTFTDLAESWLTLQKKETAKLSFMEATDL